MQSSSDSPGETAATQGIAKAYAPFDGALLTGQNEKSNKDIKKSLYDDGSVALPLNGRNENQLQRFTTKNKHEITINTKGRRKGRVHMLNYQLRIHGGAIGPAPGFTLNSDTPFMVPAIGSAMNLPGPAGWAVIKQVAFEFANPPSGGTIQILHLVV